MKYSRDLSKPLAESKMDVDRSPSTSRRGKSRPTKTQYDNKVDRSPSRRDKSRAVKTQYDNKKDVNNYSYLNKQDVRKSIKKYKSKQL